MPISFNLIPSQNRIPFTYVEFDGSQAQRSSQQDYKILVIGQKTKEGKKDANIPIRVTSEAQAKEFFGQGSMLHGMLKALFRANLSTQTFAFSIDDESFQGQVAVSDITIGGTPQEAGIISLLVSGIPIRIVALKNQSTDDIAKLIHDTINRTKDLPVIATIHAQAKSKVILTCKNKGEVGNQLTNRLNYFENDQTPPGLTIQLSAYQNGVGQPSLEGVFKALKDTQYHLITNPYLHETNLKILEDELSNRFKPDHQNEGYAICATPISFSEACTLGNKRNSPHVAILMTHKSPTPSYEWAASMTGVVALNGNLDPARPFQTLELPGIYPPSEQDRLPSQERNNLLLEGISTYVVDASDTVRIERIVSTYKRNAYGSPDIAYTSINTLLTLSYLRFDFRNYFQNKYPRHKLARDGGHYSAGQAIMTPSLAKAESISLFRGWEELGLVQNIDQFKKELIVELNAKDPSRLDFYLPPTLMNQLTVLGVKIAFLF